LHDKFQPLTPYKSSTRCCYNHFFGNHRAAFVTQGIYIMVPFFQDGFGVDLGAVALAVTALNGGQFFAM
jgi:hypothetical protein